MLRTTGLGGLNDKCQVKWEVKIKPMYLVTQTSIINFFPQVKFILKSGCFFGLEQYLSSYKPLQRIQVQLPAPTRQQTVTELPR